jgi:hypothetical protein
LGQVILFIKKLKVPLSTLAIYTIGSKRAEENQNDIARTPTNPKPDKPSNPKPTKQQSPKTP